MVWLYNLILTNDVLKFVIPSLIMLGKPLEQSVDYKLNPGRWWCHIDLTEIFAFCLCDMYHIHICTWYMCM